MANHVSLLTLIALGSILALVIAAADNWLEYFRQKRRQQELVKDAELLYSDLKRLSDTKAPYKRLLDNIQEMALSDSAPWLVAMQWIIPRCLNRLECRQQLTEAIRIHYRSLNSRVQWVKSIAPSTGLLFTVLGLMVVLLKQSQGLDHKQMLGDIGIALFTTAFSSMVLILQITLISRLNSLMEEEFETGMKLTNQLIDRERGAHAVTC